MQQRASQTTSSNSKTSSNRGRYNYDYKSGEFSTDHQTRKLEEELARQQAEPQSSQGSTARWNTPLNRSINVTLGKDSLHPPVGFHDAGCGAKWEHHYVEDREQQRQRRRSNKHTIEQKIIATTAAGTATGIAAATVASTADVEARINMQSQAHAQAMLPSIIESVKQWIKNNELGNIVIEASPKDSSPSVSFIGNPSPMAALDALTKDTPCSLLAHVNGELIKIAIGSIIRPKDAIMHGVQMPEGVFKVELSIVLNGYDDTAPPIQPPDAYSQLTLG